MKLLAFLKQRYPQYSAKAIKRAIDAGKCTVNGRIETFSTALLKKGDRVQIALVEEKRKELKVTILYEDAYLLICNKPAGLVSEKVPTGNLQLIHRLDKETSGAILLAKSTKAFEAMKALFIKKEVHKDYLALVEGRVKSKEGEISNFLGKKREYEGQSIWGSVHPKKGLRAVTVWKCLKAAPQASLLLCSPLTGRTHQLRVHFSEMGHPILGDIQYGKRSNAPRQLLHAYRLRFCHPFTKQEIEVTAPIPEDFVEALQTLDMAHFVELFCKEQKKSSPCEGEKDVNVKKARKRGELGHQRGELSS